MKKNDQNPTLSSSDISFNKNLEINKIKTTNVNILLNRVRLDQRKTLRKRIIFSRGADEIKLINPNIKNQYYFNPDLHQWEDFERLCKDSVLILGGTKVHDFFLYSKLIDSMYITVEPLNFKEGVPAFSYINFSDIIPFFKEQGFSSQEEIINDKGTKLINFKKI